MYQLMGMTRRVNPDNSTDEVSNGSLTLDSVSFFAILCDDIQAKLYEQILFPRTVERTNQLHGHQLILHNIQRRFCNSDEKDTPATLHGVCTTQVVATSDQLILLTKETFWFWWWEMSSCLFQWLVPARAVEQPPASKVSSCHGSRALLGVWSLKNQLNKATNTAPVKTQLRKFKLSLCSGLTAELQQIDNARKNAVTSKEQSTLSAYRILRRLTEAPSGKQATPFIGKQIQGWNKGSRYCCLYHTFLALHLSASSKPTSPTCTPQSVSVLPRRKSILTGPWMKQNQE